MQITTALLAALSFGSMALATDATPATINAYCDKFRGGERRECESNPTYCDKLRGGERRECESGRPNTIIVNQGGYCAKFDGRERRECEQNPNYCNKFSGNRERRECEQGRQGQGQAPAWSNPQPQYPQQGTNCNAAVNQCFSQLPQQCRRDCERMQRDGGNRPL